MYNQDIKIFYQTYYEEIYRTQNKIVTDLYELLCLSQNDGHEQKFIEHITTRIKSRESVEKKLRGKGIDPTEENAITELQDVVGVRLVVHFISDIYKVRNEIIESGKFKVIKEKDYVKNAKKTGYRGYHIIVENIVDGVPIKAEIQVRTIAMDCWASLEHEIRYKKDLSKISPINDELLQCSVDLMKADIAMEQIWSKTKFLAKERVG